MIYVALKIQDSNPDHNLSECMLLMAAGAIPLLVLKTLKMMHQAGPGRA